MLPMLWLLLSLHQNDNMRILNTIIIHCSDTKTGTVESIRNYHVKVKGWSDIGYHFVIEQDGTLKDGRPIEQVGAHCKGANTCSVGICLVGKTSFTVDQYATLGSLLSSLELQYPRITRIKGHREFSSAKKQGKTCPSDEIMQYLRGR